jgi:hypothetical protein
LCRPQCRCSAASSFVVTSHHSPGTGCGGVSEAWLQWFMAILVWFGEQLVPVRPLLTSWTQASRSVDCRGR